MKLCDINRSGQVFWDTLYMNNGIDKYYLALSVYIQLLYIG